MRTLKRWLAGTLGGFALAMGGTVLPAMAATTTPIQHLVVIFQENVSFDHYFGTYPKAKNPAGEPKFTSAPNTPSVNGLTGGLLTTNPNKVNPFRLDRTQAATCDQNHDYTPEQQAFDFGLMDKFPQFTGVGGPGCPDYGHGANLAMGYYDGNTVTAMWNYAQKFALNDNFFGTSFGPSTPGHVNLISGQTNGASPPNLSGDTIQGTIIGDPDPADDVCSGSSVVSLVTGKNVGNLLNAKGITWGFFQGGFDLTITNPNGSTGCARTHTSTVTGMTKNDYVPHHEPFQFYRSTANPSHARPSSTAAIGSTDAANHQYDTHDFLDALAAGNFPAVSFLKAPGYQDGHPGYSSPLDEQTFVASTINTIERNPEWATSTAIIVTWDDSDGWYDHQMGPILSHSNTPADALTGAGHCGTAPAGAKQGRCGYGPRIPLLVISPYAKANFVDHTVTDFTSILHFIETNWKLGSIGGGSLDNISGPLQNMFSFTHARNIKLCLNPSTGEPMTCS